MSLTDALLLDPYRFNVYLAVRTDGQKGSGTISDPYHCGDATTFDGLMNSFPEGTTVHLGPASISSPFKTAGYGDGVAGGWTSKKAMRIIGSGIDVTYLRLEPVAAGTFFAVGHALGANANVDFFEICDLTINCNLTALNGDAAAGAVRVMGNHASIRRIKAINWGTSSADKPCFVIAVITADNSSAGIFEAVNAGVHSCIAEGPYEDGMAAAVNVFHVGRNQGMRRMQPMQKRMAGRVISETV